jgi:branched-subunit amino acid ABC-type transport system permease component
MVEGIMQKWWTLGAALGLAYWFFGNLYEAVVFSPNWVVDTPAQMTRLNEFFVHTGPTLYFLPLTMLAIVLVWVLMLVNKRAAVRRDYRRAGLAALLLAALNAVIVATVVTKLFGTEFRTDPDRMRALAWQWNVLNGLRMALTATTAVFVFNAFRKLDRGDARGAE